MSREDGYLHTCSDDLALELAVHAVTWDRHDSWCEGQWADAQPEELPSQPVTTSISQVELAPGKPAFVGQRTTNELRNFPIGERVKLNHAGTAYER